MKLLRIGKSQPRHRDVEPQMGTTRRILQGSSQIEQQKSTAKESQGNWCNGQYSGWGFPDNYILGNAWKLV